MKKSFLILSFILCSSCNTIFSMNSSSSTATPQTSPSPSSQTTPLSNSQPLTPEAIRARFLQRIRAKSLDLSNLESVNEIEFTTRHAQQAKPFLKKTSSHNNMLNQQAETTIIRELMQLYALSPETPKSSGALEKKE